ncbi:hypothetical protein, partial [Mesorhizobium sp. M00.F.Ca.ET.220.01.1.1]|uniref:hypothetical protein n=1 Tax=Mesorhizobium sp. M00.F.Ca.ET.220.01.1.1 TaxID=2500531 RepID=UPI001AED61BB
FGHGLASVLDQQLQQRDGALPEHSRLIFAKKNANLRIEAKRAKAVDVAPGCHWNLLANFWERIHDFPA